MSETYNLKLPLIAASQAQKHVTVNEALSRIDAALRMNVISRGLSTPPVAVDGDVYLVPSGGTDAWSGSDGSLAFAVGGGWDFLTPQAGWRVWIADENVLASYDGVAWSVGVMSIGHSGAATRTEVLEFDVSFVAAGATIVTSAIIPDASIVFAVTGRIIDGFDGPLSDWSLGVSGSTNRYGSGLGTETNAFVRGLTGQPQSYYADTPLEMAASGGDFGSGTVRLAIHFMQFDLPRP